MFYPLLARCSKPEKIGPQVSPHIDLMDKLLDLISANL